MQAPKNRQEFLSMQQQAAAAARDMQRRATLPMPPSSPQKAYGFTAEPPRKASRFQGTPETSRKVSGFMSDKRLEPSGQRLEPRYRQPEPLHHKSPSQQARQAASYGRMQPQMRRQEWQAPGPAHKGTGGSKKQEPARQQVHQQRHRQTHRSGQPNHQENPWCQEPPLPPPPASSAMPPFADLFGLLGGLGGIGGLGGTAKHDDPACPDSAYSHDTDRADGDGGMDSIMMLLLLFLLQKENADQGLLLALMYIMM